MRSSTKSRSRSGRVADRDGDQGRFPFIEPFRAPSPARRVDHDAYSDEYLRGILRRVNVIAMVGASPHWNRPSYFAMKYLQHKGYRVIPVNPAAAGATIAVASATAEIPLRSAHGATFINFTTSSPSERGGGFCRIVPDERVRRCDGGRLSSAALPHG